MGERELFDKSGGKKPTDGLATVDVDAPVAVPLQRVDGRLGGAMHGDPGVSVCCEGRADHMHWPIEVGPVLVGIDGLVGPPAHHYRVD